MHISPKSLTEKSDAEAGNGDDVHADEGTYILHHRKYDPHKLTYRIQYQTMHRNVYSG